MNEPAHSFDSCLQIPGYSGLQLIGEGANSRIYRAVQISLGRNIALKVLKHSDDQARFDRFLNESRLIASFNHPNVITIHDVGEADHRPYIAMEWLAAGDLESRLRDGALPADEALALTEAICSSLALVHENGIVHRDIKPANIMFRQDGTPVLTDFGIAKQLDSDNALTIEGITVGTPYYLSPEQAECKPVDGRTDLYALGVVLHEMLTGRRPYEGQSATETVIAHLMQPVPSLPRELAGLQELIDCALAKDPEDRFASAEEMLGCIRQMRKRSWGKSSPAVKTARIIKPWLRRMNARAWWAAMAVAALLGYAIFGIDEEVTSPSVDVGEVEAVEVDEIEAVEAVGFEEHLARAEAAFENDHLTTPVGESAFYYYQQALQIDPDNASAQRGIARIAERYAVLAERDLSRARVASAQALVARGLSVAPDNERLLQLEAELVARRTERDRLPRRVVDRVRSIFR
jgi:tRNA A-37 threonylcarbamoyl transferase component Bud32